ncbi:Hypothetical protein, putative [Bodo saltans]|uniref:Uncharacterized protein n=1 Tax=Bodo saltans TaxID=75058 RepID=A0A0S4JQT5_BODSA|nr:Hypothetical protein, putative [Bodo saltans]|eukprot:CUG93867.1 Hypothetical protein, putative [Bodo saltans]
MSFFEARASRELRSFFCCRPHPFSVLHFTPHTISPLSSPVFCFCTLSALHQPCCWFWRENKSVNAKRLCCSLFLFCLSASVVGSTHHSQKKINVPALKSVP